MEHLKNNDEIFDLRQILLILRRRWLLIFSLTLVALITGWYLSFYVLTPLYETKTVFSVAQETASKPSASKNNTGMEGMIDSMSQLPEMSINSYMVQLKNEAFLERVLKKLELDKKGYTVASLANSISVNSVKDTNLIELRILGTDPYLAAKMANTTADEFLDFITENNELQLTRSVDFIKKQAEKTRQELQQTQGKLNSAKADPRGIAILEQIVSAKTADLAKYQSQLLQANMEFQQSLAAKLQAEQKLALTTQILKTKDTTETTRPGETTESVTTKDDVYETKTYTSTGPVTTSTMVFGELVNPAYTDLETLMNSKTVALVEKQVEISHLQPMLAQLTTELNALQTELGQKKSTIEQAQKDAVRLEETNVLLQQKLDESKVGTLMKLGTNNISVVSHANIPRVPVKPDKTKNMAASAALGLMGSVSLAFFLNYLDNTIKSTKELEEIVGLTVLGQIPYHKPIKSKATRR